MKAGTNRRLSQFNKIRHRRRGGRGLRGDRRENGRHHRRGLGRRDHKGRWGWWGLAQLLCCQESPSHRVHKLSY
jgi:hypothetical protein